MAEALVCNLSLPKSTASRSPSEPWVTPGPLSAGQSQLYDQHFLLHDVLFTPRWLEIPNSQLLAPVHT